MSKVSSTLFALAALFVVAPTALAQAPPQPGPEHKQLKELEGTWDAVMKFGEQESKGTVVYKMELSGLWLTSDFQGAFGDQKFSGKGLDGYDPMKKKYISLWVDSMSTSPVTSEGTFGKDGKVLTMIGEGPGEDGKPSKVRMTTEHKDKNTLHWTMFGPGPDGKEVLMFSITYKRRK